MMLLFLKSHLQFLIKKKPKNGMTILVLISKMQLREPQNDQIIMIIIIIRFLSEGFG